MTFGHYFDIQSVMTIQLSRKQRERLERQTSILDAAEKLFESVGYEKTTIEDIAHRTELAKGTIYLYFSSKEEIIIGLIDRGLQQLDENFEAINANTVSGLQAYQLMSTEFVKLIHRHPDYTKMFSLYNSLHVEEAIAHRDSEAKLAIANHKNRLVELMALAIDRGIKDGSVRADVDATKTALLTALTAASFVHPKTATLKSHSEVCAITPENLLQYLFELLNQAIKAE